MRVPDAQATVADAAAVAALVHALAAWLAARHDAGEPLETADTWRLEENRWAAARRGMDARAGRPAHGRAHAGARAPARRSSTSSRRSRRELGCAAELATVERLAAHGGAARQREVAAAGGGVRAVAEWLADVYAPEPDYVRRSVGKTVAG